MILARVVDEDRRSICLVRASFKVLIEEGLQYVSPELRGRVALPAQRAEIVAFAIYLAVKPRTHHQVVMIALILSLERQIAVDGAPHVFLIPEALQPHGGNLRRMLCDQLIERLSLPEGVVIRMLHH